MVTGHVQRKLAAELARKEDRARCRLLSGVEFVDAGKVEFKGVTVSVFDAVFTDGPDAARLEYSHMLESLYQSLDAGLWRGKVFEDAVRLAEFMGSVEGESMAAQSRARSRAASVAFSQERYEDAMAEYDSLLGLLSSCPAADALALEYLRGVRACYGRVLAAFAEALDADMEASFPTLFATEKDAANYRLLRTHYDTFLRVRDAARFRIRNRKALWYRVSDQEAPNLSVRVGEPK
jgi:hypothetical protein